MVLRLIPRLRSRWSCVFLRASSCLSQLSSEAANLPTPLVQWRRHTRSLYHTEAKGAKENFLRTVAEDVAFGPENLCVPPVEIARRIRKSLRGVGLDGCEARHVERFSAGQKQRLAIASVLSMHNREGRKVMRIAGALNLSLRNDFFHALDKMGVAEIDLTEVTAVDPDGLALCVVAAEKNGVIIDRLSPAVAQLWRAARQPVAPGLE